MQYCLAKNSIYRNTATCISNGAPVHCKFANKLTINLYNHALGLHLTTWSAYKDKVMEAAYETEAVNLTCINCAFQTATMRSKIQCSNEAMLYFDFHTLLGVNGIYACTGEV